MYVAVRVATCVAEFVAACVATLCSKVFHTRANSNPLVSSFVYTLQYVLQIFLQHVLQRVLQRFTAKSFLRALNRHHSCFVWCATVLVAVRIAVCIAGFTAAFCSKKKSRARHITGLLLAVYVVHIAVCVNLSPFSFFGYFNLRRHIHETQTHRHYLSFALADAYADTQ